MPFKSKAQRRWMWAIHPKMARRWEAHTPKGKKLPEHKRHLKGMSIHPVVICSQVSRKQTLPIKI